MPAPRYVVAATTTDAAARLAAALIADATAPVGVWAPGPVANGVLGEAWHCDLDATRMGIRIWAAGFGPGDIRGHDGPIVAVPRVRPSKTALAAWEAAGYQIVRSADAADALARLEARRARGGTRPADPLASVADADGVVDDAVFDSADGDETDLSELLVS